MATTHSREPSPLPTIVWIIAQPLTVTQISMIPHYEPFLDFGPGPTATIYSTALNMRTDEVQFTPHTGPDHEY